MPSRLLFVDDQQASCDVFAIVLEELGHEVTAVTSGAEALEQLGRRSFDIVLMDLNLRDMSGLSLCERVVRAHPGTAVVIVSGQCDTESTAHARRAGARDFLVKPVALEQLERTVGRR